MRRDKLRITEEEAKAIGALCISVGSVSANGLKMFKTIGAARAKELEDLFPDMTRREINYIRSFLD